MLRVRTTKSRKGSYKRRSAMGRKRAYPLANPGRAYLRAHPFGVEFRVRRMAQDATVYYTAIGFQITNNDTGAQAPWINQITAASNDYSANNQTSQFGVGIQMRLTDLPGSTEFTNLFNEYRIDKVVYRITPVTWGAINGTASQAPSAYVEWDSNDATAPTSSAIMQERDGCRLVDFRIGQPTYVVGIPRVAQQLYTTGVATSYGYPSNPKQLWLDVTSPSDSTPHYGLKMFFRNFVSISNSGTGLRIQPTYYCTFRSTR